MKHTARRRLGWVCVSSTAYQAQLCVHWGNNMQKRAEDWVGTPSQRFGSLAYTLHSRNGAESRNGMACRHSWRVCTQQAAMHRALNAPHLQALRLQGCNKGRCNPQLHVSLLQLAIQRYFKRVGEPTAVVCDFPNPLLAMPDAAWRATNALVCQARRLSAPGWRGCEPRCLVVACADQLTLKSSVRNPIC